MCEVNVIGGFREFETVLIAPEISKAEKYDASRNSLSFPNLSAFSKPKLAHLVRLLRGGIL